MVVIHQPHGDLGKISCVSTVVIISTKFPLRTLQVNKHKHEEHEDPEEHRLGKVA